MGECYQRENPNKTSHVRRQEEPSGNVAYVRPALPACSAHASLVISGPQYKMSKAMCGNGGIKTSRTKIVHMEFCIQLPIYSRTYNRLIRSACTDNKHHGRKKNTSRGKRRPRETFHMSSKLISSSIKIR